MTILRSIKESSLSSTTEIDLENSTDEEILRISISAELSAINLYKSLAMKTENKKLKSVLLDIAKEEKVHVYEFQNLLRELDSEEIESDNEAQEELKDL